MSHQYPLVPLGEVCRFVGGGTPSRKTPEYFVGDIPWASVKDFKHFRITDTEEHISEIAVAESATNIVEAGTVLLVSRVGLGKVAIAERKLAINQDIKSRVTYSVITKRLIPDAMREFILRELDRVGLAHNTFTSAAIDLVVRSADGVLRAARNLCVGCLIEAVRSGKKSIDIDNVNRVLMQPHWQKEVELKDY